MARFKKGDVVRCIDPNPFDIKVGDLYMVRGYRGKPNTDLMMLYGLNGLNHAWYDYRFVLASPDDKTKFLADHPDLPRPLT